MYMIIDTCDIYAWASSHLEGLLISWVIILKKYVHKIFCEDNHDNNASGYIILMSTLF